MTTPAGYALKLPRENPELFGQEDAEQELVAAWTAGRLHHAWLLTGPRGVGKATLAHRFARFLLARGNSPGSGDAVGTPSLFAVADVSPESQAPEFLAPEPAAAGSADRPHRQTVDLAVPEEHPVFRRVRSGGHADHFTLQPGAVAEREAAVLDPGGQRGSGRKGRPSEEILVDDVRALSDFLHLTAGEGGWRVAVIDSIDSMTRNAANALLKILEEPPRNTLLLAVSHAPGRLLPTIRSRCRHLALRPLPDETVAMLLNRAAPDLAAPDRNALVRLADGSAGRALRLLEEDGARLEADLRSLLADLPRLDLRAVQNLAERFAARRDDAPRIATLVELLDGWLATVIRLRALSEAGRVPESDPLLLRVAGQAPAMAWLATRERIAHILERMESVNLDRRATLVTAISLLAETCRPAAGSPR